MTYLRQFLGSILLGQRLPRPAPAKQFELHLFEPSIQTDGANKGARRGIQLLKRDPTGCHAPGELATSLICLAMREESRRGLTPSLT